MCTNLIKINGVLKGLDWLLKDKLLLQIVNFNFRGFAWISDE